MLISLITLSVTVNAFGVLPTLAGILNLSRWWPHCYLVWHDFLPISARHFLSNFEEGGHWEVEAGNVGFKLELSFLPYSQVFS